MPYSKEKINNPVLQRTVVSGRGIDSEVFPACRVIREKVFVEEQAAPYEEEFDDLDGPAVHYLCSEQDIPAATLRVITWKDCIQIGRVAVLREKRGCGIGLYLLKHVLEQLRRENHRKFFLESQVDKIDFYAKLGFVPTGEIFICSGIPHKRMELEF